MRPMGIEIHKKDMNIRAFNQIPQCSPSDLHRFVYLSLICMRLEDNIHNI